MVVVVMTSGGGDHSEGSNSSNECSANVFFVTILKVLAVVVG